MRLVIFSVVISCFVIAKPVNIDEILTKDKQFRILPSFSYINVNIKNPLLTQVSVQSNGMMVNVPFASSRSVNQDNLYFSIGARYGLNQRVEIFSSLGAFWQHNRITDDLSRNMSANSNFAFNTWNLGALVMVKNETKTPSLFIGSSVDILQNSSLNNKDSLQYFKRFSILATSFYSVDPIVFLLQAGFQLNLANKVDSTWIDSGEIFTLNPMIYFAVNPYISLNFGLRYSYKTRDYVNGRAVVASTSSISYLFGLAYEVKPKLIFFADVERLNSIDYDSNTINFSLLYRI